MIFTRRRTADFDSPAMIFHNFMDDGQAKPGPFFPGCKKRIKYFFKIHCFNSRSLIFRPENDILMSAIC